MAELARLLACPACRQPLAATGERYRCAGCGASYRCEQGIPVLLAAASWAKRTQTRFFDETVDAEFETSRPHGAPALYGWLLADKFRRSIAALGPLEGASVLCVCAGSGMDAEFLARAGARVISADLSLGAAQRARERARRNRLAITPVVADVERLPFADRAFDLVYVHDGLHHLENPALGLVEMARVAARAVSVNEPAQAAITRLAIRLGIAGEFEEAGNRVARLTLSKIARLLEREGFRVVRQRRYGMFYRHQPGWAMRRFSGRLSQPLAQAFWLAGNRLAGGLGNKLTVQARR